MSSIKKAKKEEKENIQQKSVHQQLSDFVLDKLAAIYVFLMLVVFPFYIERKYLNMGDAKYHFFKYVSIIFVAAMIIFLIMWIFSYRKERIFDEKFGRVSATEGFLYMFLIVSFVSYLMSYDQRLAFIGYNGWFMGLLSQTLFVLIFFFVSKFWKWNPSVIIWMMAGGAVIFLIAVLQRFDLDIFRLYENIQSDGSYRRLSDIYVEKFVSTLGQTSWYSGYEVMIIPFGMFWYIYDTKILPRVLSGLFLLIAGASLCTVNNDSAYIAIALIFMVFVWFTLVDTEKLARLMEIVLIILLSFRIVGVLQMLNPERRVNLISGEEALTEFMTHSNVMLFLTILMAIGYVCFKLSLMKNDDEKVQLSEKVVIYLRKIMIYGAIFSVWLVVLLMILVTNGKLSGPLAKLNDIGFLNFSLEWGNHRGFNWRMAIKALGKASIKDWIVGVGPDSFSSVMDMYFFEEVRTYWSGNQLACAHNEWLNMLVTQGILGFISYLGIFISIAIRLGRAVKKEMMAMPFLAAVIAYIGYNIFCYQQCICTPIIFIFMGMGEMISGYTERGEMDS